MTKAGESPIGVQGAWNVWLVAPGQEDLLWVEGLVTQAYAEQIADTANRAAIATGKRGRYEVRQIEKGAVA